MIKRGPVIYSIKLKQASWKENCQEITLYRFRCNSEAFIFCRFYWFERKILCSDFTSLEETGEKLLLSAIEQHDFHLLYRLIPKKYFWSFFLHSYLHSLNARINENAKEIVLVSLRMLSVLYVCRPWLCKCYLVSQLCVKQHLNYLGS